MPGEAAVTWGTRRSRSRSGRQSRMPSACVRIRSTWADEPSSLSCRSCRMPFVMARAMISAATPAATPATEMAVTTPTTACRRLALRYRAAKNSSNRIRLLILGWNHRLCRAYVFEPVVSAHCDQMLAHLAVLRVNRNEERIVLTLRIGDLVHRLHIL